MKNVSHTLLLVLFVCIGSILTSSVTQLYGQNSSEQTHQLQLIAKKGATVVAFDFSAPKGSIVRIDWGEGSPVSIVSEYDGSDEYLRNQAKFTYSAPLEANKTIVVDATDITSISSSYYDKGIVGLGVVDAPKLKSIKFGYGCCMKESLNGLVDLSQCPNIAVVDLANVLDLKLPDSAPLEELKISSDWKKTSDKYAVMTRELLDLKPYAATLKVLNIQKQSVKNVDISGCSNLQYIDLYWSNMYHLKGIRDARKATKIGVSQNYLGLDELPIKYDDVTYTSFLYYQQDYPVQDKVHGLSIDLSNIKSVRDAKGVEHITNFRWFKVVGLNPTEISTDLVSERNGVFTFAEGILDNSEKSATLYVEIENDLFPDVVPGETYEYRSERFVIPYNEVDEATVTYVATPEMGGTISIKNPLGEKIESGTKCPINTMLTIEAVPAKGYQIEKITLGNQKTVPAENLIVNAATGIISHTFALTKETASVTVYFAQKQSEQVAISCQAGTGGKLTVRLTSDNTVISNEALVEKGSEILLEAEADNDYEFESFLVDDKDTKPLYASAKKATLKLQVNKQLTIKACFKKANANQLIESDLKSTRVYLSADGSKLYIDTRVNAGSVRIFNLAGQFISESKEREINFGVYPPGVYIITLEGASYKVVKE